MSSLRMKHSKRSKSQKKTVRLTKTCASSGGQHPFSNSQRHLENADLQNQWSSSPTWQLYRSISNIQTHSVLPTLPVTRHAWIWYVIEEVYRTFQEVLEPKKKQFNWLTSLAVKVVQQWLAESMNILLHIAVGRGIKRLKSKHKIWNSQRRIPRGQRARSKQLDLLSSVMVSNK